MKILVTYLSQTGNTEKIAVAIHEAAASAGSAELRKIEDVRLDDLTGYDCLFVGSPLHAGNIAGQVQDFLKHIKAGSTKALAGFITHAAAAYPDQDMERFSEPFQTACRKNNIQYRGCFGCQGYLTEALHEMIKKKRNLTDEQWAETVRQMTGHPDAGDIQKAGEFAGKALA